MKRNDDVMRSDRLKQVMQEIDATFDEKNLGISKFSTILPGSRAEGTPRVTKLDNGQLEVDLPGDARRPASRDARPKKRPPPNPRRQQRPVAVWSRRAPQWPSPWTTRRTRPWRS